MEEQKWGLLWIKRGLVGILLLLITIAVVMQSPDNILSKYGVAGTDSGVFQYIGWMMTKGYVPYRDMFDHKGILLYLINYIAALISKESGVWLMEMIFMLCAVFLCYKIARMFGNRGCACFVVLLVFSLMKKYFDGGNFTEEYALPFQMAALYIFIDYFWNEKITNFRLAACGFSFASVFFLRANMISVWMVFCIMVLIQCIYRKTYKELGRFLGWFAVGAMVVVVPFLVYLLWNQAMEDFIYDYIVFNKTYATGANYVTWRNKFITIRHFTETVPTVAALLIVLAAIFFEKKRWFQIGYLVYMAATIFLVSMTGQAYNHYGMTLLPMLVYPFGILCKWFLEAKGKKRWVYLALGVYLTAAVILVDWSAIYTKGKDMVTGEDNNPDLRQVIEYITENTSEDDVITVFGNRDVIYTLSGRRSASKYSYYNDPIYQSGSEISDEYFKELKEIQPKVIIVATETNVKKMWKFLDKNGYSSVGTYGDYRVFSY